MSLRSAIRNPQSAFGSLLLIAVASAIASWTQTFGAEPPETQPPQTGPATEKRFPPLVVPEGFKATLFACDPLIEYPSAIALGPKEKPSSVFVAIDYMTGLGTEIVRHDEIRLVEDTDADGYADRATVYADGFNSIQGLTFHAGTVYAMHSPYLTALKDTDGDGKADERRDLLKGLGLPPEENDVRLHCANGIVMGHDGWLYLALGDHGCDVLRPEGDRLVHEGGAILRCRPDGRDLHLFARGLRNIYDVALDDELNVFVRDNENDGGDYKLRLCYSFFGADHGYPYLYYERPAEALAPLADLGLGSSAGGVSYLERQFPEEYRGSLLFCEWGRAVVRSHPRRVGAGFAPLEESQFAAGAENDPYGLKPTDLVVLRDGSLVVADWADGQRPKRGRGRIYRISYAGQRSVTGGGLRDATGGGLRGGKPDDPPRTPQPADLLSQLNSGSYYERVEAEEAVTALGPQGLELVQQALAEKDRLGVQARMHAVWILARDGSPPARDKLFDLIQTDSDVRVRIQAVRAIADLADPMFVAHRLDAGAGDLPTAARLAALANGQDARVVLEIVVALGRLRWPDSPQWLPGALGARPDPVLMHAAMQTLRQSENWTGVLKLLDVASTEPIQPVALGAVADQAVPEVVSGLIARLADGNAVRRTEYADALSRVHKKPGPWKYWGYRPPPRPANSVAWERTAEIERALDGALRDADRSIRLAILQRMQREEISVRLETLTSWLSEERFEPAVAAILKSLPGAPAEKRREMLAGVVAKRDHALANRVTALELLEQNQTALDSAFLLNLAGSIEDGPVLAELLHRLGDRKEQDAVKLLTSKLGSPSGEVRIAAIDGLVKLGQPDAGQAVSPLLDDREAAVRAAAAAAIGRLHVRAAVDPLLRLAGDTDPVVRRASLDSLRRLAEPRVVPLAVTALADRTTQMTALECLAELGGPEQFRAVIDATKAEPSEDAVNLVVGMLTKWSSQPGVPAGERMQMEQAARELQGQSGLVMSWRTIGPLSADELSVAMKRLAESQEAPPWTAALAHGPEGNVALAGKATSEGTWLAYAELLVSEPAAVQWIGSASGKFSVWLNGQRIYESSQPRRDLADLDRFDAALVHGTNRVIVQVSASSDVRFQLRFRRKSSTAEHERLVQAALTTKGNPDRGRQVFFDAKSQCSKCHRIGNQGERFGPELTGIGNRFSRIHIVESILEPSRTVTPGFQTIAVRLVDGRTASGIRVAETDKSLTLADQKGQKLTLAKEEIEAQQTQPKSTMPDGLAQQLTVEQFRDLVAFLVGQQDARAP